MTAKYQNISVASDGKISTMFIKKVGPFITKSGPFLCEGGSSEPTDPLATDLATIPRFVVVYCWPDGLAM